MAAGVAAASPPDCTLFKPLLNIRPTQIAPITVPTRISIPLSPTRYSFTVTGSEVSVKAARVPHAALCTACAIEAGHTLPV